MSAADDPEAGTGVKARRAIGCSGVGRSATGLSGIYHESHSAYRRPVDVSG